ncbi:cell division ATPase MinD [Candidatus Woesearchaeota archaeon]|nr:cell division ATPase MinD [Candidatus Woesearchaeota archaeon]
MMRAIAISGGKGGTGKTTTAINLALALNYFEKKTIIIDCNVTTPNISLHFGTPILPVTLHDVLAEKKEISEAIYSHETGTMVIPASISYENLKNSNLSSLPKIIEELKSQADFIILDCAAGLDKEVKDTLKAANEILIVTNPELPAVTDALKTIRLCQDLKRDILGIVVNKTNVKNKDMKIEAILDVLEKEIIGIIPEDKYIKEALAEKQPVVYSYPKSASAIQYKKLAANILGIEYDEKLPKDINSGNIFDAILRFLNIKE